MMNSKTNVGRMARGLSLGLAVVGGSLFGGCGGQVDDETVLELELGAAEQPFHFPTLRPTLDCVEDLGGGDYRAHFGYENTGGGRSVGIGWRNRFVPLPRDQGQPTFFAPGTHDDVFSVDFAVGDGWDRLAWWLLGRRALATASSPACDPGPEPDCVVDADCTQDSNPCTAAVCTPDEVCETQDLALGTECGPGGSLACDGAGSCVLPGCNDEACVQDSNPCTAAVCTPDEVCETQNLPENTPCGPGLGGLCDDAGVCQT